MADFDPAVSIVIQNEGGYSNDSNDPGGETNMGISKRQYPDTDIKDLSEGSARIIYLRDFWQPFHFQQLSSQAIANKVFDLAVNIGPVPAIRMFQQALGYFVAGPLCYDGKIGPLTVSLASQVSDEKLLPELRARAAKYHADLIAANPSRYSFALGWFRRDVR